MLLQTLVQINLLILATPALAGWALLPLSQPGVVRACVVAQGRGLAAVAPKNAPAEASHTLKAVPVQPAVWPFQAVAAVRLSAEQPASIVAADAPSVVSSHPFPYAARAP